MILLIFLTIFNKLYILHYSFQCNVIIFLTNYHVLGYNVDETEQAWNEMYDAIRWQMDIPALHLEPLLRQRVSRLHHALENA